MADVTDAVVSLENLSSLKHKLRLKIPSQTSACDLTSSAGDDSDPLFSHPRDLDLIQSVPPVDLLSMKAPPRVLTLTEQPLDSLETDQTPPSQSHPSQAVGFNWGFDFTFFFMSQ